MFVSFKDNQVFDVTLTVVNDQGIATYLDLANRYGLRLNLSSKAVLSAGRIPTLTPQTLVPIDAIEFLSEEELTPLGYYDPTGCVPDALYERLISAQEAYESARDAFLLAAAAATYKAIEAARICYTAETIVTVPACLKASREAAIAAVSAAYLASRMRQAANKVEQIRDLINERMRQCRNTK